VGAGLVIRDLYGLAVLSNHVRRCVRLPRPSYDIDRVGDRDDRDEEHDFGCEIAGISGSHPLRRVAGTATSGAQGRFLTRRRLTALDKRD
jgi:hypothetical protein